MLEEHFNILNRHWSHPKDFEVCRADATLDTEVGIPEQEGWSLVLSDSLVIQMHSQHQTEGLHLLLPRPEFS